MPVLDGYEATRRIRAMEADKRHTPIIAMSAAIAPADREKCRSAGMDEFLGKPLEPKLLYEMLEYVLTCQQHVPFVTEDASAIPLPPVDVDVLDRVTMGNTDFKKRISEKFLLAVHTYIDAASAALLEHDYETARKIFHTIKGSCSQLGVRTLADRSKRMLNLLDAGDTAAIAADMEELTREYETVKRYFLTKVIP